MTTPAATTAAATAATTIAAAIVKKYLIEYTLAMSYNYAEILSANQNCEQKR